MATYARGPSGYQTIQTTCGNTATVWKPRRS